VGFRGKAPDGVPGQSPGWVQWAKPNFFFTLYIRMEEKIMKMRILPVAAAAALALTLFPAAAGAADRTASCTSPGGVTVNITRSPFYVAGYNELEYIGEGVLKFRRFSGSRPVYGLMDLQGEELCTFDYEIYRQIERLHEGKAGVKQYDPQTGEYSYGFIDINGKTILSGIKKDTGEFHNGLARVQSENFLYGYIDSNGNTVIPAKYDKATDFNEGYAVVSWHADGTRESDQFLEIIDARGKTVWQSPYHIEDINGLGRNVRRPEYSNPYESTIIEGRVLLEREVEGARRVDWVGIDGSIQDLSSLVPDKNGILEYLGDGRFRYRKSRSGPVSIISRDGELIFPYTYLDHMVGDFDSGVAIAGGANKGIIDLNGDYVIKENVLPIHKDFVEGMTVVSEYNTDTGNREHYFLTVAGTSMDEVIAGWTRKQSELGDGVAHSSTQSVTVDGKTIAFQMYALKDTNGNPTNYIKLRDLASVLKGTPAQFGVTWNGVVNLIPGGEYVSNGTEMSTPFAGDRTYTISDYPTLIHGADSGLDAIILTDSAGGLYTYYRLRDLGKTLGFNVGWNDKEGVFIQTDTPYQGV